MYGLTSADFNGHTVQEALPGPASQILAQLNRVLATNETIQSEITLADPTPGARPTSAVHLSDNLIYLRTAQPVRDADGETVGVAVALMDITERKRAEALLLESEENLRYTVELTPHMPWTADATGEVTYISPRWEIVTGQQVDNFLLSTWASGLHPQDSDASIAAWSRAVRTGDPYDAEYRVQTVDGSWRWMRARAFPRRNAHGAIVRWYGTVEDIHDRKLIEEALQAKTLRLEQASEELAQRAREDHLTGLANRRRFDEMLQLEIRRAVRSQLPLALILLDIDHFKHHNDTYGHPAGDECLRVVAHAISVGLRRPGDLAARYGGEEFAILLPATSASGALDVANAALAAVRAIVLESDGLPPRTVTISAGVALLVLRPDNSLDGLDREIVAAADSALYKAKTSGRDRAVLNAPTS